MDPHATRGESTSGDPAPSPLDAADSIDHAPLAHIRIGRYQLKREISTGGMGTVFEAVQDQPRRIVALKLMRGGLRSRGARRRFEYESQLLARLRHPAIAQVFDAGTHLHDEHEVPYYVMEFIPGAHSITDYARNQNLTIRQRLELFVQACDAVHHAHQKGIIHRDIKPPNMLVDGLGAVKVIDFGVARASDADLTPLTLQTEMSQLLGTLQYMSPEQSNSDPSDIDARSDVYSLGIVLYELLCERLPYQVSRENLVEAVRIIRESGSFPPRQACAQLDSELETILLKAIHKERSRRYASAAELADDIRRFLAGEPIAAKRDSATYLLRKRAKSIVAAHRISMWVMTVAAAMILAQVVGAALRRWTPLDLYFHRTVTTRIQPVSALPPMSHVRMIAMQDGTDWDALAKDVGAANVNALQPTGLRPLHGKLFEKLAEARARVVAVDIFFRKPRASTGADPASSPPECPFEKELLDGIRILQRSGTEVVLTAGELWDVNENDQPQSLCPALASEVRWGFITCTLEAGAPWSLHLLIEPTDHKPMLSLALAACAAYWQPQRFPWVVHEVEYGPANAYARVHYARPDQPKRFGVLAESYSDLVRLTRTYPAPEDIPGVGRQKGDIVGEYAIYVPPDNVLNAATIDYADVLRASPQQLRQWFEGKVIVVGDYRAGRDGPFPAAGGRQYPGFVAHAVGIDSILSNAAIVQPSRTTLLGMSLTGQFVFELLCTVGAAVLGLFVARPNWRRRLCILLLSIVIVTISVLLYRQARVLYDPLDAVLGAVLAVEGVGWFVRARGNAIG